MNSVSSDVERDVSTASTGSAVLSQLPSSTTAPANSVAAFQSLLTVYYKYHFEWSKCLCHIKF